MNDTDRAKADEWGWTKRADDEWWGPGATQNGGRPNAEIDGEVLIVRSRGDSVDVPIVVIEALLAARAAQLEAKAAEARESDLTRCAVCGWPLGARPTNCRPGDCSLRPRPTNFYAPKRAEAERR